MSSIDIRSYRGVFPESGNFDRGYGSGSGNVFMRLGTLLYLRG